MNGVIRTSGELIAILPRGVNPATPQSAHQVKLDVPYRGFQAMRSDPADLLVSEGEEPEGEM